MFFAADFLTSLSVQNCFWDFQLLFKKFTAQTYFGVYYSVIDLSTIDRNAISEAAELKR